MTTGKLVKLDVNTETKLVQSHAKTKETNNLIEIDLSAEIWDAIISQLFAQISSRHFMVDCDALTMGELAAEILAKYIPPLHLIRARNFLAHRGSILHIKSEYSSVLQIPATPTSGFGNDTAVQLYDALLLGAQYISGVVPVAFEFENNGRLMRNVIANPDSRGKRSSHGYDEPLGFHTDNPCGQFESSLAPWASSLIPRTLGFVGLRNRDRLGKPVSTDVLSLDSILAYLNEEAFLCLQRYEFQVNPPASNSCRSLRGTPLIELIDGSCCLRFNTNPTQVFGLTEQARWSLQEFANAIVLAESHALKFEITSLSILLIDNYGVTHARRNFDPGDDLANSRWLRRCYGLSSSCSGRHVDRNSWPYLIR
jgi:L-asparagine oxygenase